jgi:hypothetical protein
MYQREFEELQRQLAELLDNEFIRPSTSLLGALVFFFSEKDVSVRMWAEYRAINQVTVEIAIRYLALTTYLINFGMRNTSASLIYGLAITR